MVEAGIQQLLVTDAGVNALVGSRVFPVVLPTDFPIANLPAVTIQCVSASPEFNLDGSALQTKRIDLNVFANRYLDAKNVQAAIANTLAGFTGALPDGTVVLSILPGIQMDDFNQENRVYRTLSEYSVIYQGL